MNETSCIFQGMKNVSSDRKAAISQRLSQLAREKEIKDGERERGRHARIARFFEKKGERVTQQSIRKWFNALSEPTEDNAKLLGEYLDSTYLWILYGEGPARHAMDVDEQKSVPIHFLPLLAPEQFRDWKDGTLKEPVKESVQAFGYFPQGSFCFLIQDNSALPRAAKGMIAVVIPDEESMSQPVTASAPIVVLDRNQFLVGDYSKTPYPSITPPNHEFRTIELSDSHEVVGTFRFVAQHTIQG